MYIYMIVFKLIKVHLERAEIDKIKKHFSYVIVVQKDI